MTAQRYWEFTMKSKTKWLTSTVVRVQEGKLEQKLLEMMSEWELYITDRTPMRLLEVS
jgi:hypothetical protein